MPLYFQIVGISAINILCMLLCMCVALMYSVKININHKSSVLFIVIAAWIICRCISYSMTGYMTEIIYFLLRTVGVFWALDTMVKNRNMFMKLIKALVWSAVFVSFFGLVEAVTHFNIFSLLNASEVLNYNPLRFGILRILSFSSHAIVYGVYLMFGMSLCLYYMQFVKGNKRHRNIYMVAYVLIWLNMILSLSRSIIILALLAQFMILYFSGARKLFKILFRITCATLLLYVVSLFLFPNVARIFENLWYMVLAVFNNNYSTRIAASFGDDNLVAMGHRMKLFRWVLGAMPGHWVVGHGLESSFNYGYTASNEMYMWMQYKKGIEVQYLDLLYRYGLIGLISEVIVYITLVCSAIKLGLKKTEWENVVSFNAVCFSVLSCYFVQMFAVNQSSDINIFYIFVIVFIIYNKRGKFEAEEKALKN